MKTVHNTERLHHLIHNPKNIINASVAQLTMHACESENAKQTTTGAISVTTGQFTGRSPKDRFFVSDAVSNRLIAWNTSNQSIDGSVFQHLYDELLVHFEQKERYYTFIGGVGHASTHTLPVRIVTEYAWQQQFVQQMFVGHEHDFERVEPFTVLCAPSFKANPTVHGTRSETFILIALEERMVLIGGTHYAGEIKKSMFTVMNALLPERGVLPMHCSANEGADGSTALFFGLSGTGKTTLSTCEHRKLIGDDEHAWDDEGIFNFEGGCYAKCIGLSEMKEPEIYRAIQTGTVLENVVVRADGVPDYHDSSLTENTRAAYPLAHIENRKITGRGTHPRTIIFLTADAFGVLPPVSRLSNEQAIYHFLSGYTSKLAGTEHGITKPTVTFSTCFGEPFMPLSPETYAHLLSDRIQKYDARVYLVNTGWTGGQYGIGARMPLNETRTIVNRCLDGSIEQSNWTVEPYFGLSVPVFIPGIPSERLTPVKTWTDSGQYQQVANTLIAAFHENFKRFTGLSEELIRKGEVRMQ
ncbi:MAG: phosphoenolpyruvate carboxykinase (ATP) [Bacilli bacterium]